MIESKCQGSSSEHANQKQEPFLLQEVNEQLRLH